MTKEYMGDSVYVEVEEDSLILTTENGVETTNRIILNSEVWTHLCVFVEKLK